MRNKEKRKEYNKKYYLQNKEKQKEYRKQYRLRNKDKIRDSQKQYQLQNRKRKNEYETNKRKTDINFRLSCNLRSRLQGAIKNKQKNGSAVKDLGCTVEYLKRYLESQFVKGMSWENYGKWEIDHQIPLSKVDLEERENLLQVCHYTNLQIMWKEENIRKSNFIDR